MTIAAIIAGKGDTVHSIAKGASVREAAVVLAERNIGAVPVMDGDTVLGILSERDIVGCLGREGAGVLDRSVDAIMTAPAITVEPAVSALAALSMMTKRRIRHLPVVVDGRVRAIVSIGDLVKYRIDRIEAEAEAMRLYIQS